MNENRRIRCNPTYAPRCLVFLFLLLLAIPARAQLNNSTISITPIKTPSLTPCSGADTFVVRIANITTTNISNLTFRDSMPPGISYVTGSVSGTNVSFGSTIASNVVTFAVSSLPASSFVDISFTARASCSVSTVSSTILNTYTGSWSSFFTSPVSTSTYGILFPSLSITPGSTATYSANCLTPFVRSFTICNGGFGAVDSVTFTDVESNSSLIIKGFSSGTQGGLGTNNARTVLKAADFATIGNMDGKLDQNECIVLYDTLMAVGSTSPIAGTYTANWGCNTAVCSNPSSNTFVLNTTINAASPQQPALTRTLVALGPPDTPGQIYNRPVRYMEIVKNNSPVTAVSAKVLLMTYGLKYINTDSVWASKNGGVPYHPSMFHYTGGSNWLSWSSGTPADYAASLTAFPNSSGWSNAELSLGDLVPGDSVVITFEVRTAGPVTRVNVTPFDHCFSESFCGACVRGMYGPAISGAIDARMTWQGCPTGTFSTCSEAFPQLVYNGLSATPLTEFNPKLSYGHFLANFSGFSFTDSTNLNGTRCAYYHNDTVRVLMTAGSMDLPFYTDKSKFCIKIYTNGGVHWDGNLARTVGRLSSWSSNPWYADHVVDSSAIDSTIRVYFSRSNCPVPNFTTNNAYNCYRNGQWRLAIGFVNTCPGPAQKRLYMTRIYTIDTTNGEPGIESGPTTFPASYTWNSNCASSCTDGVSILNYQHARTTLDEPDNNNDGVPDASGSLNMNIVNTNLITWSDTLRTSYKMVVHTTQPGGVPYMYIKSSINHADINTSTSTNNILKKTFPQVTLTRGNTVYTGVGTSTPVSSTNQYTVDLSLQGSGGVPIAGITAYQDGDTLEVIENLVYWTPRYGTDVTTFSFLHVPYTSLAANPAPAQQYKCDSAVCNFQTLDMTIGASSANVYQGVACGDSMVMQYSFTSQTAAAACGSNYFPGETRTIITPTYFKMAVPANGPWSVKKVYLYYQKKIHGTGSCTQLINNQPLPISLYTQVGDTMYFDLKQIGQFYGQQIDTNDTRSVFSLNFAMKYQPTTNDTGCVKDHAFPQTFFYNFTRYTTRRPMDSTTFRNRLGSTTSGSYGGNGGSVFLNWPGTNNNTIVLYAGSTQQVTTPQVIIPFTYGKAQNSSGNDFFALPGTPGIAIDSVKDDVTGNTIQPIGGDIYPVGYLAANSARNYKIYARVVQCNNSSLKIYADRLPCSGYPASWASYSCKSYANSATYNFVTFAGELQMSDSLFSTHKDICTYDTVQFKVVNSQTQTANGVKISFTLPASMSLVPGQALLKYGNGTFTSTTDPVFNAGTYTWTQPAGDTLAPINAAPSNLLYLWVVVNTNCGYVSGSQIYSSITGNVACGPITALFNTNPLPLQINGAPSLSYLTNVSASAAPITGCGATSGYDYRVSMHISGSATGASDSVKITLPQGYAFVSYNPLAPGSTHAPAGSPVATPLANGSTQLSWVIPGAIAGGDSIIFTFKYNETSAATNKCGTSPQSFVSTQITSGVFCASIGATCAVAISNGEDTVDLQSLKPDITNLTTVGQLGDANGSVIPGQQSYLHLEGTWTNDGTADVPVGTSIIMEPFVDLDNSGSITPGDYTLEPLTYNGGLEMNGNHMYNYTDSFSPAACPACGGKNVLVRFSNNPSLPLGSSQCFCDSVIVTPVIINTIPLDLLLGALKGTLHDCNQAMLKWNTYAESGTDLYFEMQASTDGSDYNTIGTVRAKGVSGSDYEHVVDMPSRKTYFRLIMHANGKKAYSKVLTIESDCWTKGTITAYPNPFGNAIYVKGAPKDSEIALMDITGRKLLNRSANGNETDVLDLQGLASGTYMLTVTDTNGEVTRIKLSKD